MKTSRPRLFWVLVVLLGAVSAAGGLGLVGVARSRLARADLESRLDRIEEQLESLGSRSQTRSPTFVLDPAQPVDKASLAGAVAALSREVAELRAALAAGGGGNAARALDDLLQSQDPNERRQAIRRLRDRARNDPEARRQLARLLGDPDGRVRRDAVNALASLGDPALIPDLLTMLGDQDAGTRGRAARAVSDLAKRSTDSTDREKTALALESMLADPKAGVRKDVAEALRRMGGKEAVPALVKALGDKSFEVQEQAIEALTELGDASGLQGLRQAYGDGAGPNALEAALALKKLGDPGPFQKEAERLRTILQQGGSSEEKREALRLLADNLPQERRAILERALRDPSEAVRREAQQMIEASAGR